MAFHDDSAAAAAATAEDDDFFGDQEEDETCDSLHMERNDRVARIENPQQASSSSTTTTMGLAMRDAKATEEQMRNVGYLEAFEDSKEIRLQAGFEAGYRETVEAAMRIGQRLIGASVVGSMNHPTSEEEGAILREDPNTTQAIATTQVVGTLVRAFLEEQQPKGGDSAEHLPSALHALETQLADVLLDRSHTHAFSSESATT